MTNGTLKSKILSGLFWQYFQRIGNQLVGFIVSVILARLLLPEDFGAIALIGVFITISNIFVDSGFGNALIQRKDIDDVDTSSVFYTNIVISVSIYVIIYIISPFVAQFYEMPILCALLRIQALQVILMAFYCVQNAMLVRNMKFKINFYVNLTAVIISSIIGITCAYNGCGVWSLVASQLTMQIINVVGYWIMVGWRPKLIFSFTRIRSLLGYGSRILAGSLLHVIYNNVYNLIIGKRYSSTQLGYYNRGQLIPTILVENAANTINGVMFPAMSSIQDDRERLLVLVRKMVSIVAFVVFLLISLLLPLSHDIVIVLLTEKWLPCVPFMQIVCVTVCFTPFILINSAILTSLGESDKYLKTTFISKLLSIILILLSSFVGIYFMVAMGCVAAIISVWITGFWNNKLIGYSWKYFLHDILPSMILAIIVSSLLFGLNYCRLPLLLYIIVGGLTGLGVYCATAYFLKFKQIRLILETLKKK